MGCGRNIARDEKKCLVWDLHDPRREIVLCSECARHQAAKRGALTYIEGLEE
jgi:hypothetical protein